LIPAFEATVAFAPDLGRIHAGPDRARPTRTGTWFRALARSLGAVAPEALDRSTGLFDRAGLFTAVAEELQGREDVCVSAVVLEFSDLREVREIYGATIARKVVAKVVRRLRAVAGMRGFVGRTGPAQFTIALPGVGTQRALRQLQRALGKPARVEFDAGDSEIVLVPDFVVDTLEPGSGRLQDLYRDLSRELARMQKVERRRLDYLTTERERHSRPMAIRQH
jgi:GGDEF domain-containing protein